MQKYLRNDIADLLKNDLDTNAYGRVRILLLFLFLVSGISDKIFLIFRRLQFSYFKFLSMMKQCEDLLVELNHTRCYDLMDQYCEQISSNLSIMSKQRYITCLIIVLCGTYYGS